MPTKKCRDCGISIDTMPAYYKVCMPCYRKAKVQEVESYASDAYRKGWSEGFKLGEKAVNATLMANLDSLIQLCHPDKHNNSPASNRITSWLLKERKKR